MTTESIGSTERPLSVAVVGAGPAGFYTVEALLKQKGVTVEIDLLERLPAPHGLVRYGVAPDHQKIKSVSAAYDRLCQDPRVRFLGNVSVGDGVTVEEVLARYDQVVFAVGCAADRRLEVPGEDLRGSHAATSFVAWYNGHPDHASLAVDLDAERAVIVGIGDVAMDLSRMLLKSPDELAKTDVAEHALRVFRGSRVREVVLLARRGPAQAAFATKELEDIAELPGVQVVVDATLVRQSLADVGAQAGLEKRKLEYLAALADRPSTAAARRLEIRFLASPVEILGDAGRVAAMRIEHNELVRDADGNVSARGTGRHEDIPAGLVFRSVGYRAVPVDGLPFDARKGIIPNAAGRVVRDGAVVPRAYVSGWIKRGPSGVIGTNKSDAAATVESMLADLREGVLAGREPGGRSAMDAVLRARGARVVTWEAWQRIDRIEKERGKALGKVRDKLTTLDELLAAAEV